MSESDAVDGAMDVGAVKARCFCGAHSITSSAQPSIRDFARNGVYAMPRACKLLRFDARKLDHPGPFLSFIGNKLAEVRGRTRKWRAAQIGKPRLDLGFDKTSINFFVESVDYLSGCLPGRGNAEPRACLEAGQEIADGWPPMTVVGTKLPILDVCSTAAVGGKADEIWLRLSSFQFDPEPTPTAHPSAGRLLGAPAD